MSDDENMKRNVANVLTGAVMVAVTAVLIGVILGAGWRLVQWVGGF